MFSWIGKLFRAPLYSQDDAFARGIVGALGGRKALPAPAAPGEYVMEAEMAELRERIAKLESVLLPLRNGSRVKQS